MTKRMTENQTERAWTGFSCGPMAEFCEYGDELSSSVKAGNILTNISYQLFKENWNTL
jgi:hypothetical protein